MAFLGLCFTLLEAVCVACDFLGLPIFQSHSDVSLHFLPDRKEGWKKPTGMAPSFCSFFILKKFFLYCFVLSMFI